MIEHSERGSRQLTEETEMLQDIRDYDRIKLAIARALNLTLDDIASQ